MDADPPTASQGSRRRRNRSLDEGSTVEYSPTRFRASLQDAAKTKSEEGSVRGRSRDKMHRHNKPEPEGSSENLSDDGSVGTVTPTRARKNVGGDSLRPKRELEGADETPVTPTRVRRNVGGDNLRPKHELEDSGETLSDDVGMDTGTTRARKNVGGGDLRSRIKPHGPPRLQPDAAGPSRQTPAQERRDTSSGFAYSRDASLSSRRVHATSRSHAEEARSVGGAMRADHGRGSTESQPEISVDDSNDGKKQPKPIIQINWDELSGRSYPVGFALYQGLCVLGRFLLHWPIWTVSVLAISSFVPNLICAYSSMPCLLRRNTEAFTKTEIAAINQLFAASRHGLVRATDLITASTSADDLRVLVGTGLSADSGDVHGLQEFLNDYCDGLRNASHTLIHVEASVWALTQAAVFNNEATHSHLRDADSAFPWPLDILWWKCSGPSRGYVYRSITQLLDALQGAANAVTRDAWALKAAVEKLRTLSWELRSVTGRLDSSRVSDLSEGQRLVYLWDSAASSWIPRGPIQDHRRRALVNAQFPDDRSFDYVEVFIGVVERLSSNIDQARTNFFSSTSSIIRLPFYGDTKLQCASRPDQDRKPFQSLLTSARELRDLLGAGSRRA
ncbi:hypothetical protein PENSPDRAFT_691181 [Peniophora sp. CONT]|nr:hypothetical protein PENSPDRAFT_691181 [Peniophora sp. CONT]